MGVGHVCKRCGAFIKATTWQLLKAHLRLKLPMQREIIATKPGSY